MKPLATHLLHIAAAAALVAAAWLAFGRGCDARAEPPCPPLPEPSSLAPSWQPAGCFGPHDLFAFSTVGYLRREVDALRCGSGAPATTLAAQPSGKSGEMRRTLPPWAWALIAGAGAIAAPPVTCRVGEACSDTADGVASLTAAALAFTAAWVVED